MTTTDKEIAELAESIGDFSCPDVPIDPEQIAREHDITWTYGAYDNAFDGLLAHKDGRFHIFCNATRGSSQGSRRGRFTFSHELGHYFIDEHRHALSSGAAQPHLSQGEWKSDVLVERQADHFAANLLMPRHRLLSEVERQPLGMSAVLHTSEVFRVSITSAAVRYLDVCPVPCAIALWKPAGQFSWAWSSAKAHAIRLHKMIDELGESSEDFATARAVRGADPGEAQFFENITTASTWFRYVPVGGKNNIMMLEQSMRLGDYGVLTVLCEHVGSRS